MDAPAQPIPLTTQFEAASSCSFFRMRELLGPFGFQWHPKKSSRLFADYRHWFTFTPAQLLAYLRDRPDVCEQLQFDSENARCYDAPFFSLRDGGYVSGWVHKDRVEYRKSFDSLEAAAADYVLTRFGMTHE